MLVPASLQRPRWADLQDDSPVRSAPARACCDRPAGGVFEGCGEVYAVVDEGVLQPSSLETGWEF